MSKHTPGPWVSGVASNNGATSVITVPDKGAFEVVADIPSENDDDARLIAAAPEMLAALKSLDDESEWLHALALTGAVVNAEHTAKVLLNTVRAAIKKADPDFR